MTVIKSIVLFAFFFLSHCISSTAQQFISGLSLGVSATQIDGDHKSGYNKPGIIGGAFVQRKFSDKKAIEFQIIYIQKGSRHVAKPDKNDYSSLLMKLNYLEIPLLYKYSQRKFTYELGLSYGFLLSSYVENETGTVSFRTPVQKTETTINVGLNYSLSQRISINWRFSYSVLPVVFFANWKIYDNLGYYNNVLHFALRYHFNKIEE